MVCAKLANGFSENTISSGALITPAIFSANSTEGA
jgi:hypothetical protein